MFLGKPGAYLRVAHSTQ